jgi:AcrR family transcriptional regulator
MSQDIDTQKNEQNSSDRRNQILMAAIKVFSEQGFAATRVDDVAALVGISKPAVYLYFRNKEELFKAAATFGPDQALPFVRALVADTDLPSDEKLKRLLEMLYAEFFNGSTGELMPVIAETTRRFPNVAQFFRDTCMCEMDEAVLGVIREGVERGTFVATEMSDNVALTVGPILALALRRSMFAGLPDHEVVDIEQARLDHERMVFRVLMPEG